MDDEAPAVIEVSVLCGTLRRGDGSVVTVRRRRDYELLLALAEMPRGTTREYLIDRLWPDLDAADATNALGVAMHRVRTLLGSKSSIVRNAGIYRFSAEIAVDLNDVETAWRGLSAKSTRDADDRATLERIVDTLRTYLTSGPPAPSWFEAASRRLQTVYQRAAAMLAEDALGDGESLRALLVATDLIAADPFDERARELNIEARLAVGDRVGALREFREYEALLLRSLQISPSPSVTRLAERARGSVRREAGSR
jgi:DNA-binding SARP family transcriptional activator